MVSITIILLLWWENRHEQMGVAVFKYNFTCKSIWWAICRSMQTPAPGKSAYVHRQCKSFSRAYTKQCQIVYKNPTYSIVFCILVVPSYIRFLKVRCFLGIVYFFTVSLLNSNEPNELEYKELCIHSPISIYWYILVYTSFCLLLWFSNTCSHQNYTKTSLIRTSPALDTVPNFLTPDYSAQIKWCVIICTSLIAKETEHPFITLWWYGFPLLWISYLKFILVRESLRKIFSFFLLTY